MTDNPRRRLADRVSTSPTFIGAGSALTGDLECDSDLVVAAQSTATATCAARSRCPKAALGRRIQAPPTPSSPAKCEGTLTVGEKLELRHRAREWLAQSALDRGRQGRDHRRRHGRDQRQAGRALRRKAKGLRAGRSTTRQAVDPLRQQRDACRVDDVRAERRHAAAVAAVHSIHHNERAELAGAISRAFAIQDHRPTVQHCTQLVAPSAVV